MAIRRATISSAVSPALAADAPSPYYATPLWDQQLPASTRVLRLGQSTEKFVWCVRGGQGLELQ